MSYFFATSMAAASKANIVRIHAQASGHVASPVNFASRNATVSTTISHRIDNPAMRFMPGIIAAIGKSQGVALVG